MSTRPESFPSNRDAAESAAARADGRAAWIGAHQTALWRYLRYLGAGDAAEDLLQECLLRGLARGAHRFDPAASHAFLRRTARNLLLDRWRRAGRRPAEARVELDRLEAAFRGEDWEPEIAALRLCVAALSPRERAALELRYAEGASRAQIGAEIGCSEAGVKTMLRRLRARLRVCVERRTGGR